MTRVPDYAAQMLSHLHLGGHTAYAVGGCVRDSLLGRTPNDWDITTSATPEEIVAAFDAPPFSVRVGTGIRHGTVTVCLGRESCEITTFRTEGNYSDHRRPDSVSFVTDIHEDLARRDFTINAMAYTPADAVTDEELLDLHGGRQDIAAQCIRAVGDAKTRFTEDALRILRGIRFAARLGFRVDAETAGAMHECAHLLAHIAPERIGEELRGILAGAHIGVVLPFGDVLAQCLPDVCQESLSALCRTDDVTARLACLTYGHASEPLRDTLIRLGFGIPCAEKILLFHRMAQAPLATHADRCAVAAAVGKGDMARYFAFRAALHPQDTSLALAQVQTDALFAPGVCYSVATLAVTGHDLIRDAGATPGAALGSLLRRLTDAVIRGEIPNEKSALLCAARIENGVPDGGTQNREVLG